MWSEYISRLLILKSWATSLCLRPPGLTYPSSSYFSLFFSLLCACGDCPESPVHPLSHPSAALITPVQRADIWWQAGRWRNGGLIWGVALCQTRVDWSTAQTVKTPCIGLHFRLTNHKPNDRPRRYITKTTNRTTITLTDDGPSWCVNEYLLR